MSYSVPGPISSKAQPELARAFNQLRQAVLAGRLVSVKGGKLSITGNGTTLAIDGVAGGAVISDPFRVHQTDSLEVKVTAGTVHWQAQDFTVAASSAIAVPASSTAFRIWLALYDDGDAENEFAPTYAAFDSGEGGWSGYPAHPHTPARLYWLLATVASSGTAITTLTRNHAGGDIQWLPTPYSFWD